MRCDPCRRKPKGEMERYVKFSRDQKTQPVLLPLRQTGGCGRRRRGVPAIRRRQQQRTAQRSCGSSAIGCMDGKLSKCFFMMTPAVVRAGSGAPGVRPHPTMRWRLRWAKSCPRRQRWRSWICFRCPRSSGTRAAGREIHFFDRLKALASLYEFSGDADSKRLRRHCLRRFPAERRWTANEFKTFSPKQKLARSGGARNPYRDYDASSVTGQSARERRFPCPSGLSAGR